MFRSFVEIRQVFVWKIGDDSPHVLSRQFNKIASQPVPDSAGTAVQHEPHGFCLIQTNFDEMISRSQRPQMICLITAVKLRMFFQNRVVPWLQFLPHFRIARGNSVPGARVSSPSLTCASVRNRFFYCFADFFQILWQIRSVQIGLCSHHPAADVHTDRGRDDCAVVGITLPTVAPIPQCTYGMAASHLYMKGGCATFFR
jgi:hypothetical protein